MDSPVLLTVVGVAVVVLFIILTGLCLNCKGNSQPTCIRQQHNYNPRPSYVSSQGFTVVRSYVDPQSQTVVPVPPPQHSLMTSPLMTNARRNSDVHSSDGGSQSDYINQNVDRDAESYEQPPEKTPDYPDYLDVLPDDHNMSQQNLASSLNSGQSYQNIKNDDSDDDDDDDDDSDSDSQHYINVIEDRIPAIESPVGSCCSSDDQGSSEYVNAPEQIRLHTNSIWDH